MDGKRVTEAGERMQKAGSKITGIGCALTLLMLSLCWLGSCVAGIFR